MERGTGKNLLVEKVGAEMSLVKEELKIRIGIGMGAWPFPTISTGSILDMIERWEELDIDSLWLSDHITAADNTMEPVVFMSFVASRMQNMMLGTSVLRALHQIGVLGVFMTLNVLYRLCN